MRHRITRFFQTPKGLLTLVLAVLIAMAAPGQGLRHVAVGLGSSSLVAGLVDAIILRFRKGRWEYPSGAALSAAIVVMVLRAQEPWYVVTITALIAILSKYVFRVGEANLFNPAAMAMVASYYLFHAGQSWWGAQTDVVGLPKLILMATGVYSTNRVNKVPLVLTFLGTYFALFTATAFIGDPLSIGEIFHTPDMEMILYFAFFILTDPPTSPPKYRDQVICGPIVAAASYGVFKTTGLVYFPLAGVLMGNLWEGWRRMRQRRSYAASRAVPSVAAS
jgi:Na+-translocating ferredoxin:NAD+ oxidoreductase RnfD subunit